MTLRCFAFATLLLVAATAPAQAGDVTLYTPVAEAGVLSSLRCSAVNTGKKAIAPLTVAFVNSDGSPFASNTCPAVDPGGFCITTPLSGSVLSYCQITYNGSKKVVRGVLQVIDANSNNSVLSLDAR